MSASHNDGTASSNSPMDDSPVTSNQPRRRPQQQHDSSTMSSRSPPLLGHTPLPDDDEDDASDLPLHLGMTGAGFAATPPYGNSRREISDAAVAEAMGGSVGGGEGDGDDGEGNGDVASTATNTAMSFGTTPQQTCVFTDEQHRQQRRQEGESAAQRLVANAPAVPAKEVGVGVEEENSSAALRSRGSSTNSTSTANNSSLSSSQGGGGSNAMSGSVRAALGLLLPSSEGDGSAPSAHGGEGERDATASTNATAADAAGFLLFERLKQQREAEEERARRANNNKKRRSSSSKSSLHTGTTPTTSPPTVSAPAGPPMAVIDRLNISSATNSPTAAPTTAPVAVTSGLVPKDAAKKQSQKSLADIKKLIVASNMQRYIAAPGEADAWGRQNRRKTTGKHAAWEQRSWFFPVRLCLFYVIPALRKAAALGNKLTAKELDPLIAEDSSTAAYLKLHRMIYRMTEAEAAANNALAGGGNKNNSTLNDDLYGGRDSTRGSRGGGGDDDDKDADYQLPRTLGRALLRFIGWGYVGVVWSLLYSACPFGIVALLDYVSDFIDDPDEPMWHGYVYAAIALVFQLTQAFAKAQMERTGAHVRARIHGALLMSMMQRCCRPTKPQDAADAKENNSSAAADAADDDAFEDDGSGMPPVIQLVTSDCENIAEMIPYLIFNATQAIEIVIAFAYLAAIVGWPSAFPIAVFLFLVPFNKFVSDMFMSRYEGKATAGDARSSKVEEVMSNIRTIKYYAWEGAMERDITGLRKIEVLCLRSLLGFMVAFSCMCAIATPLMQLSLFAALYFGPAHQGRLDSTVIYQAISLLSIPAWNLSVVPYQVGEWSRLSVSLRRLSKYLNDDVTNSGGGSSSAAGAGGGPSSPEMPYSMMGGGGGGGGPSTSRFITANGNTLMNSKAYAKSGNLFDVYADLEPQKVRQSTMSGRNLGEGRDGGGRSNSQRYGDDGMPVFGVRGGISIAGAVFVHNLDSLLEDVDEVTVEEEVEGAANKRSNTSNSARSSPTTDNNNTLNAKEAAATNTNSVVSTRFVTGRDAVTRATLPPNSVSAALGAFALRVDEFVADPGELILVVGKVGSGKSSLLASILSQMICANSQYASNFVDGKISIVPQSPWILNGTVRNNIILDSSFNEAKYQLCLAASALAVDLSLFGNGDATVVGAKGATLSGGQRQRLSIARALYCDADIYVFDDSLSALDATVGRQVFDNAICGLLKSKTRIVVTHQLGLLPMADRIYVVDDGNVVQQSLPDEVSAEPEEDEGPLAALLRAWKESVDVLASMETGAGGGDDAPCVDVESVASSDDDAGDNDEIDELLDGGFAAGGNANGSDDETFGYKPNAYYAEGSDSDSDEDDDDSADDGAIASMRNGNSLRMLSSAKVGHGGGAAAPHATNIVPSFRSVGRGPIASSAVMAPFTPRRPHGTAALAAAPSPHLHGSSSPRAAHHNHGGAAPSAAAAGGASGGANPFGFRTDTMRRAEQNAIGHLIGGVGGVGGGSAASGSMRSTNASPAGALLLLGGAMDDNNNRNRSNSAPSSAQHAGKSQYLSPTLLAAKAQHTPPSSASGGGGGGAHHQQHVLRSATIGGKRITMSFTDRSGGSKTTTPHPMSARGAASSPFLLPPAAAGGGGGGGNTVATSASHTSTPVAGGGGAAASPTAGPSYGSYAGGGLESPNTTPSAISGAAASPRINTSALLASVRSIQEATDASHNGNLLRVVSAACNLTRLTLPSDADAEGGGHHHHHGHHRHGSSTTPASARGNGKHSKRKPSSSPGSGQTSPRIVVVGASTTSKNGSFGAGTSATTGTNKNGGGFTPRSALKQSPPSTATAAAPTSAAAAAAPLGYGMGTAGGANTADGSSDGSNSKGNSMAGAGTVTEFALVNSLVGENNKPAHKKKVNVSDVVVATSARDFGDSIGEPLLGAPAAAVVPANTAADDDDDEALVGGEKFTDASVLSSLLKYLSTCGGCFFWTQMFGWHFLTVAFSVAGSWWLGQWSEENTYGLEEKAGSMAVLGIYAVALVLSALVVLVREFAWREGCLRPPTVLFEAMTRAILAAPVSFFDVNPIGRILTRFTKDSDMIDYTIPTATNELFVSIAAQIGSLVAICVTLPYFTPLAVLVVIGVPLLRPSHSLVVLRRVADASLSPVTEIFSEADSGTASIVILKLTRLFMRRLQRSLDEYNAARYMDKIAFEFVRLRVSIMMSCIGAGVIIVMTILRHSVNPATAGFVISQTVNITNFLSYMVEQLGTLTLSLNSVARVNDYCKIEPERGGTGVPPQGWPRTPVVEFRSVRAQYRPDLPIVIKNLNITLAAGEKIGVCGRTGSGKSTLIQCLLRMVPMLEGSHVVIDGVDTAGLDVKHLRRRLTVIPQEPVIFEGTLRYNLDPVGEHDDARLLEVLYSCQVHVAMRKMFESSATADSNSGRQKKSEQPNDMLAKGPDSARSLPKVDFGAGDGDYLSLLNAGNAADPDGDDGDSGKKKRRSKRGGNGLKRRSFRQAHRKDESGMEATTLMPPSSHNNHLLNLQNSGSDYDDAYSDYSDNEAAIANATSSYVPPQSSNNANDISGGGALPTTSTLLMDCLETPMSGSSLSVGQKQLLCLARAVLRGTNVLILDEATSSVDAVTDQLIQTVIRTVFNGCTVLTIAHRINTIVDSDRILVMDKGTVAEFDTPGNLLKDPATIFSTLVRQSKEEH